MNNSNDKSRSDPSIEDPSIEDPSIEDPLPFDSLEFTDGSRDGSPGKGIPPDRPSENSSSSADSMSAASHRSVPATGNHSPRPGKRETLSPSEIRQQRRDNLRRKQQVELAKSPSRGDTGGLALVLLTTALVFGVWFAGPRLVEEYHYAAATGRSRAEYEHASVMLESDPLASVSYAYQMVAQKVRPSVVSITAYKRERSAVGMPGLGEEGLGSGVIISADGDIVTNAHVLDGGYRFFVELHDRRRYSATLIGVDKVSDLALLRIKCDDLLPASWGDSDALDVGSIVWAFGNPYQLKQTVTSGIISGKDRPGDLNAKQALLQTDAAINKGNSGGPLVDSKGHVIGINTAILGETFQGIGFAVPSSTARYVVDQLRTNGKVTRGFLGVTPVEVSNLDARRLALPDLNGAKLVHVMADSPAALAGFRSADVIREWNGIPIKNYKTLYRLAEMTPPDSTVNVRLIRDGLELDASVRVGNRELIPIQ